jgi:hypothetical protein
MAEKSATAITDADIRALAAKLKGLHTLLTPAEQTLLHTVLRRAAGQEEPDVPDTAGFGWRVSFNPFRYLDTIAADLRMERERRDG